MGLWIFQTLLNLAFLVVAALYLINRRQLKDFETELARLRARIDADSMNHRPAVQSELGARAQFEENKKEPQMVLKAPVGALREHQQHNKTAAQKKSADAYELASELLSRGHVLSEVSRQTGLSLSELQLLRKISTKNN